MDQEQGRIEEDLRPYWDIDEGDTYNDEVCWTLQGNWYRRSDGEEMTGAGGGASAPMTIKEFYRRRRKGAEDES